jgi:hypothetical protein
MVTAARAKQVEVVEPDKAIVHHRRVVTVPTPTWFSQQKRRNVRSNEYAVFTCIVFSGSVTSGKIIAPG